MTQQQEEKRLQTWYQTAKENYFAKYNQTEKRESFWKTWYQTAKEKKAEHLQETIILDATCEWNMFADEVQDFLER